VRPKAALEEQTFFKTKLLLTRRWVGAHENKPAAVLWLVF